MPGPLFFFEKSPDQIRVELAGFPAEAVDAALRFRGERRFADLDDAVTASMRLYVPRGSPFPYNTLSAQTRLREDLGIDSLSLTEMVFKFDELLGVPIETREAAHIQTVGQLHEFLRAKLENSQELKGSVG
jgi:acyl carrier protein